MLETTALAATEAAPVRAFNVFFGLGSPAPLQAEGFAGVLEPLERADQELDVVTVDGAEVLEAELLEQDAGNHKILETFLDPPSQGLGLSAESWDLAQQLPDIGLESTVDRRRDQAREILAHGAHIAGDGHPVLIEDHDHVFLQVSGLVEALEGDADVAREEITDAYSRVFGIPLSLLSLSPTSDIVDLLSTNEGDDAERILSLAELLKMDGEIYQKEGDVEEAQWRFDLSLELLIASVEVSNQPAVDTTLGPFEPIVRLSIQNQTSLERLAALYALYREAGNYGLAKDLIVAFVETDGGKSEGIDEGTAFLSDLLGRADEELERGNTNRQEIEEALETLEALRD